MKNKNMFLIILVSLFVLTSIMSVSVKGEFNCHIKDTLLQGESKTYTVNHLDHYIQPTIITNTYPYHVKFNVNGKLTDILKVGDTFTLVDGAKINVIEILQSEAGDETGSLVQFCFDGDVTNYDTVCTDSDGGKNYYVKGKTEGKAGYKEGIVSETDSCFNCNNLAVKSYSCDAGSDCCVSEGYCLNNEVFIGSLQCPNGCKDGACIKDIAFSCDIKDTLAEGKSKTYTIHGIDYDVKPIVITNIHPYKVKFVVNDELTYLLGIGGAFTLSNGARIAVIEILPNEAGDITSDLVEFCFDGKESEPEPLFENYPDFLIKDNKLDAIVVVGENAPPVDSIAAADVLIGLRYYSDGQTMHTIDIPPAILSSKVSNPKAQNMILIGRPTKYAGSESNPLIDDFTIPSLSYGGGLLKIVGNGDRYVALIVTARDEDGVRKVAQYLRNYQEHSTILKGAEVRINYETSEKICTDSDRGRDYYVKGYTINENGVRDDDVCMSDPEGKVLNEYHCDGNEGRGIEYICPNGCKDGACIKEKECIKEGEWGSFGDECCEGLKNVGNWAPMSNGECTMYRNPSFKCTNCGNGVCGLGENSCNCREDCEFQVVHDYVDIYITPEIRTINYGDYARYEITIKDKHPLTKCMDTKCINLAQIYTYKIDVNNLPFLKEYKKQVTLSAGGKTSFTLTIKPYQLSAVEIEEVATVAKVQKITASVVVGTGLTGRVIDEMIVEEHPQLIQAYYAKQYKFNVKATLSNDSNVQDRDYAVLIIKPEIFIEPPEFPTEEITIRLYKGWNLISLPGKLVQFTDNGCTLNRKLLGFIYIKEKQKYVTLQEAQNMLGDGFREYLAKNAFWIYSYEDCSLKAKVDVKMSYSGITLYEGWNLIPITEDMVGGYLSDVMSECNVQKIYKWNPQIQDWKKITTDYIFLNTEVYYGFITKVSNNCMLGGVSILEISEIMEEE